MIGRRGMCLVALCLVISANDAFAQRSAGRMVLPTRRLLARHGLERAWWSQATIDPSRDRILYMVADEEVVFVQSRMGIVTAFDANSGKKLWAVLLGRKNSGSFPLTSNDEMAVVVSGMYMYALDKFNGKIAWQIKLSTAPSTSAVMDEKFVYVGSLDGSVYAYDLRRIRELFDEGRLPQWTNLARKWRFKAFKEVSTPPVSLGYTVNFASRGGSLYAVTADQRKLVFQFETDASISAPMTHSRGAFNKATNRYKRYLYMASEDFKLYCIDSDNGRVRWEYSAGLPIRDAVQVIDHQVFITPVRGGLHCVDRGMGTPNAQGAAAGLGNNGGNVLWKRPEASKFLAATPTMVMASDRIGNIMLLSRNNGAIRGVLPLRGFEVSVSNGRTDRVFIATKRGLVACIRETGREFPIYHKFPDRRPILPGFAKPAPKPPQPTPKATP